MHRKSLIALFGLLTFVPVTLSQEPRDIPAERVNFSLKFDITSAPDTDKITLNVLVPADIEGRQKIIYKKYSHKPEREFQENGSSYARIVIDNPPRSMTVTIDYEALLYGYDLGSAIAFMDNAKVETKKSLAPFLVDEKYLEVDDPSIQKAAKSIPGKNDAQGVRNVMDFVAKTLQKTPFDPADHGAVWALKNKHGDCTEFADLFVTLCRAKGIPARVCEGYITMEIDKNDSARHNWAEVYLDDFGWVPFDPLHTFLKLATFDHLRPIYMKLSHQRVDPTLNGYHFWSYRNEGGQVKVQDSFTVTKRNAESGR
ncbi:MAG TPA: transglutaminase domain-containing protein [Gemmataceae bacterium]|jgi:transglutaminase-like putative cysteine protease|nr:transglutaminase domain-containing protein [Gemmataceae bacterium]